MGGGRGDGGGVAKVDIPVAHSTCVGIPPICSARRTRCAPRAERLARRARRSRLALPRTIGIRPFSIMASFGWQAQTYVRFVSGPSMNSNVGQSSNGNLLNTANPQQRPAARRSISPAVTATRGVLQADLEVENRNCHICPSAATCRRPAEKRRRCLADASDRRQYQAGLAAFDLTASHDSTKPHVQQDQGPNQRGQNFACLIQVYRGSVAAGQIKVFVPAGKTRHSISQRCLIDKTASRKADRPTTLEIPFQPTRPLGRKAVWANILSSRSVRDNWHAGVVN